MNNKMDKMDKMDKIINCEVCGNSTLKTVLNLGSHPMCDDLVEVGSMRHCKEYPIEILWCDNCFTAHQKYQIPKEELFPSSYHYRSRFTADVLNGMKNLVNSCEKKFGSLAKKKILDIGCNDGSLLNFFKEKNGITFGIEPTDAYKDAIENGHIAYNEFLSPDVADNFILKNGKPDIITFTNVFAHIENLHDVLKSLKILLSPDTIIIIENHYLGSVLSGNQFDTFYHEHPRTYSYTSFLSIAKSLGCDLLDVEFPSRYGGNIRIFMGDKSKDINIKIDIDILMKKEKEFVKQFESINENIVVWKRKMKARLSDYIQQHGKLKAKAFPGRAAILIKLLDLDENSISAVYEKPGSMKIGHYLPGTRVPIISDDELLCSSGEPILNLAWHISDEIKKYLKKKGCNGDVVDILDANDFL